MAEKYHNLELVLGSNSVPVNANFKAAAKRLNVTFTGSIWTPADTSIVTTANAAMSANVASAEITAVKAGCTLVKVTGTTAGDTTWADQFKVTVTNNTSCS